MGVPEFNQILVSNSDFLKPYAITLTRDSETASDLFQETLYRALANRDKYNVGTNIRAWLYTIMRNIFINNYRRRYKREIFIDSNLNENIAETIPAKNAGIESGLIVKDILAAVHRLPDIFRNPFMLYFEGFKYHEIANILSEPLGTVKSRIHFARKSLRTSIGRY